MLQQNAGHYQQSISYWWRQSLSQNWFTAVWYLSVNITTISNTFCPLYTSYFTYLASSASLRTNVKANGAYDTINHFACKLPNVHRFLKYFHQQIEWHICNEVAHTHTHPFNGPFSGTTQVSRYQKGKSNLGFTEARDSEWQLHHLGYMQVCISLQTDNHASNPWLSFLQAGCPSCRPTNSVKAVAH